MMRSTLLLVVAIAMFARVGATEAAVVTYGDPPDAASGNFFPFTGDGGSINNRYQQVYASSFFSGITQITAITFFNEQLPGAVFETADYTFTLSTSNFVVNALDTSNLNNNPGADATLFASVNLSGATGASFTITAGTGGGAAFIYDPSGGDLLVDIVRTNQMVGTGSGFLDARNGTAAGQFSRAHNYGAGFENFGLKTQFTTADVNGVPEPASLAIWAIGLTLFGAGSRARRRSAST
jgi:hypothetical protein